MKTSPTLPRKADEGADAIGALVVVVLALVVGIFVAAVLAMLALAVGPLAGGLFWWSHLTQRYQISTRKKVTCALAGTVLVASPIVLLAVFGPSGWHSDHNSVLTAVWLGALLGLCGTALYLGFEAYRQVFWQHRKHILAEQWKTNAVRLQLQRAQRDLHRLGNAIARKEKANQQLVTQQKALAEKIDSAIRASDAAFYSAEKFRWQRIYAEMGTEDLMKRRETLNQELVRIPDADPRSMTCALEAAVVRLEIQDRMLACERHGSYRESLDAHREKAETVAALQRSLQAIQTNVDRERAAIQELRRARPVVN